MIDFVLTFGQKLATDPRSILIVVSAVVCWLFVKEKPSAHAAGGALVFVLAFSLFVMWRYAPGFEKLGEQDPETMNADELRIYIGQMREATDVLWRQMEMYVAGVHLTAGLYLAWVLVLHYCPPHLRDIMAQWIVCVLLGFEVHSLATGNFWCRFILETKGSWLVDHLMVNGRTPGSCSVHWGQTSDWWPAALAALLMLLTLVIYQRARDRMT